MGLGSKSKVYFFYDGVKLSLENRTRLKQFIEKIFETEGTKLKHLNYIFCTDKRLLEINRQYLNHDFYTDIISFVFSESGPVEGEIYISTDRVKENAKAQETSFRNELLRVIFHGPLHMCGYGDKKPADKAKMTAREDFWINKYLK